MWETSKLFSFLNFRNSGLLACLEHGRDVPVRPALPEVLQGVPRVAEDAELHQEDADHGAGPPLAALAVHRHHVRVVLAQPRLHLVRGKRDFRICKQVKVLNSRISIKFDDFPY